jgi:hypothetical protein
MNAFSRSRHEKAKTRRRLAPREMKRRMHGIGRRVRRTLLRKRLLGLPQWGIYRGPQAWNMDLRLAKFRAGTSRAAVEWSPTLRASSR